MTALEELGSFVARFSPPSRLDEVLRLHLIDTVGAWAAGLATAEGQALLKWRDALRDGGTEAVHGTQRLRLDLATHCALARLGEIDDIHLASTTTPGAIVIPAAVTIAATLGDHDPAAVAAAMIAGYETMVRLGRAIDGATVLYRGIWPTYFSAPAAVAAVAARLFGLDRRQAAHALALALVRSAPGVGAQNGVTASRWLAIGQAAETGLLAAIAARTGFTSDLGLLDGPFLSGVYRIEPDRAAVTASLGVNFALDEVSIKPWCAARQTMAATQAVIELVASGVPPNAIAQLTAFVPPPQRRMVDHGVRSGDRGSFLTSLPYRMALAVLAPAAVFDVAQARSEIPSHIQGFMNRIVVEADERLLRVYPQQWPARVEAITDVGRHAVAVASVPGDPGRPFDGSAVAAKFMRYAAPAVGSNVATGMLEQARTLLAAPSGAAHLLASIEQACELALHAKRTFE